MQPSLEIRPAGEADLPAITEIYNEAIVDTTATFDTQRKTLADRQAWFAAHDARHPVLVAALDGRVVAWSALTAWSDRPAYADTVESTFYVRAEHRGQGIGRALKAATIDRARQLGFHSIIARIAEGSQASIHLNESFGFVKVGTLKQVGRKFGRLLDVHIYQKMLRE